MTDPVQVEEAKNALVRKDRERNKKLLQKIKQDGWESPEEVLKDLNEVEAEAKRINPKAKVPRTMRGTIGGRRKPQLGMENVTADDMLPSRHLVEKLIKGGSG